MISLDEQRERLAQLQLLVAERIRAEAATRASFATRESTLADQIAAERNRLTAKTQAERETMQSQYSSDLTRIVQEYEAAVETALAEHESLGRATLGRAEQAMQQAHADLEETRDRLRGDCDRLVREIQRTLHEFKEKVEERRQEPGELEAQAMRIIRRRRCRKAAAELPPRQGRCDPNAPLDNYATEISRSTAILGQLRSQFVPRLLSGGVMLTLFLIGWFFVIVVGFVKNDVKNLLEVHLYPWPWIGAGAAIALGLVAIMYVVLRPVAIQQTLEALGNFQQALANANMSLDAAIKVKAAEADTRRNAVQQQFEAQQCDATAAHERRLAAIASAREVSLREAADSLQNKRRLAVEARDTRQRTINSQFSQRSQQVQQAQDHQHREMAERHQREVMNSHELHERSWKRLVTRWRDGLREFQTSVENMWSFCDERFPPWESPDWQTWRVTDSSLPALRFGRFAFSLRHQEGGVPEHEDLRPECVDFDLPAVMSFAKRPSFLLEAWGDGRIVASRAMQNVMLRLLTSLPPGKVRFTIIDPVGLGQNFSAFMHLADFDEKLITHRIWTETQHINQRLADLTQHMEDVIQTYLRNEFQTIDDYNRQAGEVSEPFHVLVVANFPAGFSDEAAQRLLSIVNSGARCGVYSIISTDDKLDLPRAFDLADLESHAATVQWTGSRYCWRDETLKDLPLTLDDPPTDERMTQIIREIGRRAKDAIRVEVPFATVACRPESWWTHDSRGGIEVALGRAGASKLQFMRLGKGTSQHVLISGKTGSGKSTLLHAFITNTAVHYSPDEVEFYLIDFKKGVEFKPYASRNLPHARVVAIESEREFGLSVLERLDQELRLRGDLFRKAGVQDIRNFRDENPGARLPRLLLIIDEFQEFFTSDDKLAQDAALLLDRLVRQGRAFGVHVVLGSQTLAGAYSLARSTLGQMAVRIALQCSEADSHLILSEDNTAARLLNRPGEAIYNDANGLFEGNHPFQVVWLASKEQDDYLDRLAARAAEGNGARGPAIVFEGNAPANPAENPLLRELLSAGRPADPPLAPKAWLGSAIAIKDPTAALFRRQSGANLLVVGQKEDMALGMLANCIISLGAAFGKSARLIVLDGTRPEAPEAGWWRRYAEQVPLNITVAGPNDAARIVGELATSVAQRIERGGESETPVFLLTYNLARFRDLRRSDDDFSFSSSEEPASASKQFVALLRDGPGVGIHTLLWCDTFNTAGRWLDRQTLRDCDQRVLFQMSANDSSNLMDSPAASRLGEHRAILFSEELGQHEKFRPYGPPTTEWLRSLAFIV